MRVPERRRCLLGLAVALGCFLTMGCQQIVDRLLDTEPTDASSLPSSDQSMPAASAPMQAVEVTQKSAPLDSTLVLAPASAPAVTTAQIFKPQVKAAPLRVSEEAVVQPLTTFKDCQVCPQMVRIPNGTFRMGSPASELGRDEDEGPIENVAVAAFALGRNEVTFKQWREFERQSGYRTASGCLRWTGDGYELTAHLGWRYPGFEQSDEHPVVCISWRDAQAYVQWLSAKVGQIYRLPTEAEWEYSARAGGRQAYPWYSSGPNICAHGNAADASLRQKNTEWLTENCSDDYPFTAPVGSFPPNNWGLYDMNGNVMEWVENCWSQQLQSQKSEQVPLNCRSRVMRGGGWDLPNKFMRSAFRGKSNESNRGTALGLRVARSLP